MNFTANSLLSVSHSLHRHYFAVCAEMVVRYILSLIFVDPALVSVLD